MLRKSRLVRKLLPENPLFRLLLINGLAGALLGIGFVSGVLALDIGSLRTLLAATGEWAIGLALLLAGSIITFASVTMGGAIMLMPKPGDEGSTPPGGRGRLVPAMARAGSKIAGQSIYSPRAD